MKNNEFLPYVTIIIAAITIVVGMVTDNYYTNKSRTEIYIACVQSEACTKDFQDVIKPIK